MTKRVLIAGGFGFVGSRLACHLFEAGYKVILGSRNTISPPPWLAKAEVVQMQWDDLDALEYCCRAVDVVIHAAGMNAHECSVDPVAALAFNGVATARFVSAASRAAVDRFIYISTAHVYTSPLLGSITEETCPSNLHPYATSHLAGEQAVLYAVKKRKINGIIMRLSNSVGPPTHPDVNCWMLLINDLCLQAIVYKHLNLYSDGLSQRDFVPMEKVCITTGKLISLPYSEIKYNIFNVGGGQSFSIREIADLVASRCELIMGYRPEITIPIAEGKHPSGSHFLYRCDRLSDINVIKIMELNEEIDSTLKFCDVNRELLYDANPAARKRDNSDL